MTKNYRLLLKLSIVLSAAITFAGAAIADDARRPPADNDETYKLPIFVPKAALPKNAKKINFNDNGSDNDEMYSITPAAPAPAKQATQAAPAAGTAATSQEQYQQQMVEYQKQLEVYNQQMAEYKKQLELQQQGKASPTDNDSSYVLPGQYSKVKKQITPAKNPPRQTPQEQPAQQYQPPVAQQYQAPAQQYPSPQPQAAQPQQAPPTAAHYNQRYNYSDQYDSSPKGEKGTDGGYMPNYYY